MARTPHGRTVLDAVMPRWRQCEYHEIALPPLDYAVLQAVCDLTWAEVPVMRRLMALRGLDVKDPGRSWLARLARRGRPAVTGGAGKRREPYGTGGLDGLRESDGAARPGESGGLGAIRFGSSGRVMSLFEQSMFQVVHRSEREIVVVGLYPAVLRPAEFLRAALRRADLGPDPVAGFRAAGAPGTVKVAFNFLVRGSVLSTETRCWPADRAAALYFGCYWPAIRAGSGLIRRGWLRAVRTRAVIADAVLKAAPSD